MTSKSALLFVGKAFRLSAYLIENWPWIVGIVCILSPISPHMSVSVVTGWPCDYVGTRGIVKKVDAGGCPLITILDTRTGEAPSVYVPSFDLPDWVELPW